MWFDNVAERLATLDRVGFRLFQVYMSVAAGPLLWALSINGSDRGPEIKAGTGNWIQPLDCGTFDMLGFLKELHRTGYRGPIGLQCYGVPGDAAVHLRRSMAAWRRLKGRINGRA